MSRSRACIVLTALLTACAEKEVGRATFFTEETREITVKMSSAGEARFDTEVEVDVPFPESSINEEWQYTITTNRNGASKETSCDAFNVGPGRASTLKGHRLKLTRSRLLGCRVALEQGTSTLRVRLAAKRGGSGVTPVRIDLIVVR